MSDERARERDKLRTAAELVIATGTNKDWYDTIDAGALAVARAWLKDDARIARLRASLEAVVKAWTLEASQGDGIMEEHGPILDAARAELADDGEGGVT